MARPERFELPTDRFVADYSIQLSYGRVTYFSILPLQLIYVNYILNSCFGISGGERGIRTLDGS